MISPELLSHLSCLDCKSDLSEDPQTGLFCKACHKKYPKRPDGVYDFSDSGKEWNDYWSTLQDLDSFMESREIEYFTEISPQAFEGKIVLEIGCGSGATLEKYLKVKPRALLMVDVSDAVGEVLKKHRNLQSQFATEVMAIKADLYRLPFKSGKLPVTYTSSGLYNILKDQQSAIQEAMRFSHEIFLLFNSPKSSLGRIFYWLNPVRRILQNLLKSQRLRCSFAKTASWISYPFAKGLAQLAAGKEIAHALRRESLEFLIHDWLFISPQGYAFSEGYYQQISNGRFSCRIFEKPISRIVHYQCK